MIAPFEPFFFAIFAIFAKLSLIFANKLYTMKQQQQIMQK